MKKTLYLLLFVAVVSACTQASRGDQSKSIQIQWTENLEGDFSFKNNWSYPEGVFRNEYGQLSCDGICPLEIDNMIDDHGEIREDSLEAFYNLVDTAHLYHSIVMETNVKEWAGTDFIFVKKVGTDTLQCVTSVNAGTHSYLNLIIVKDMVTPTLEINSVIASDGIEAYECSGGEIIVDKNCFQAGILKASFNFSFKNEAQNDTESKYCRGQIYAKIETP